MRSRIRVFIFTALAALACMTRLHAADDRYFNVEVDISFVSFELSEIETMARQNRGAAPTCAQIRQAWMEGHGKLVATSKLITISGQQTKTEGVLEKIFPTEYQPPMVAGTWANGPPSYYYDPHPKPGSFQTRAVGCIVTLTPQIDEANNGVNLTMTPELSRFLGWNRIEAGQVESNKKVTAWFLQPDVQAKRVATTLIVPMGETLITGGMPDSTGRILTYLFITARKNRQPQ